MVTITLSWYWRCGVLEYEQYTWKVEIGIRHHNHRQRIYISYRISSNVQNNNDTPDAYFRWSLTVHFCRHRHGFWPFLLFSSHSSCRLDLCFQFHVATFIILFTLFSASFATLPASLVFRRRDDIYIFSILVLLGNASSRFLCRLHVLDIYILVFM